MFANYTELLAALQKKRRDRKALIEERDALPLLAVSKKRELTARIEGLSEEIHELQGKETAILGGFRKEEALRRMAAQPNKRGAITKEARKEISEQITAADEAARRYAQRETTFEAEYQSELRRFDELRPEAEALDPRALTAARLAIRPEKEKAAFDEIRKAFPGKLPVFAHSETVHIVDHDLNESGLENQFRKQQKQQTMLRQPQPRASGSKKKQQDSHESL